MTLLLDDERMLEGLVVFLEAAEFIAKRAEVREVLLALVVPGLCERCERRHHGPGRTLARLDHAAVMLREASDVLLGASLRRAVYEEGKCASYLISSVVRSAICSSSEEIWAWSSVTLRRDFSYSAWSASMVFWRSSRSRVPVARLGG